MFGIGGGGLLAYLVCLQLYCDLWVGLVWGLVVVGWGGY